MSPNDAGTRRTSLAIDILRPRGGLDDCGVSGQSRSGSLLVVAERIAQIPCAIRFAVEPGELSGNAGCLPPVRLQARSRLRPSPGRSKNSVGHRSPELCRNRLRQRAPSTGFPLLSSRSGSADSQRWHYIRFRGWLRVRAAVRASAAFGISEAGISETVEIRVSRCHLGPGVVGILRPVLLFPEGIAERLTPSELETVLAHELCHVRRRDNLFAAIHMIVEAAFWFHPLVWWISARLVEEREQACDEEVLSLGSHPEIYADAILNVCKFYAQSPLIGVSGVSGASIRRRIEAIMLNRFKQLSRAKKLLLAAAGTAALAGPVAIGLLIGAGNITVVGAQSPVVSRTEIRSRFHSPLRSKRSRARPPRNGRLGRCRAVTQPGDQKMRHGNDSSSRMLTSSLRTVRTGRLRYRLLPSRERRPGSLRTVTP